MNRFLAPCAVACIPILPACHGTTASVLTFHDGGGDATILPPTTKVDVLFMIDDSPSMSPKQKALATQFGNFLRPLVLAGADFHVGIVTSDVGALPATGSLSGPLGGKCDSVTGDDGRLQAVPCSARAPGDFSSGSVQGICSTVCPTPTAPMAATLPDGSMVSGSYIAAQVLASGALASNVPGNDVTGAFGCLAFVGDTGCGIEMQLESVKRAFDGSAGPTNLGFLRPDAVLALVLVTDEDDCSVQNRMSNDPMTMDCSPGGKDPDSWRCYNPDYRCFAEGTRCSQPLDQAGTKTGCAPRPMNDPTNPDLYLYDVTAYEQFFDSIKPAGRVLVFAIDTPFTGPAVIDANLDGPDTPGLNRADTSDPNNAACYSGITDPVTGLPIIGKPETRLHAFVDHFAGVEYSICGVSGYGTALADIATRIAARL